MGWGSIGDDALDRVNDAAGPSGELPAQRRLREQAANDAARERQRQAENRAVLAQLRAEARLARREVNEAVTELVDGLDVIAEGRSADWWKFEGSYDTGVVDGAFVQMQEDVRLLADRLESPELTPLAGKRLSELRDTTRDVLRQISEARNGGWWVLIAPSYDTGRIDRASRQLRDAIDDAMG